MAASKVLVVIGITGNQGSSVANAFFQLPDWHIRGISRDPTSPAAQHWISRGVEVVKADIDNIDSLKDAFRGATAIFAVTDIYNLIFNPANISGAHEAGITVNEYARNIETKQGMNIAIAANCPAVSVTLTHFIFSNLSDTKRWSRGKYTWNFHFDGKADVVKQIKEKMPDLAAKLSTVQVGMYTSNWKGGMGRPQKQKDGSFVVQIPDVGEVKLPWIFVERDTGVYVKALLENSPGKDILAVSEMATWRDFWTLWANTQEVKLEIQVVSVENFFQSLPAVLRREFQESLMYIVEFGYTGSDPDVCYTLQDLSPGAKTTPLKEYMESEDWSSLK
ncbi:NmrA-like family domain-containing protein 1 [Fusarium oxysporum f. sp. cubense]|uniref:NmrA-like family domain-containing protein 1 n=1 Tax=Fusarium oxysporum f. sp. cubense TaxID=61366 RepID=A0A559KRP9_FUSOC|nr:NmrA-like family domain-containing protein 1 [Fusarium oxysporum f. sp. cubense]